MADKLSVIVLQLDSLCRHFLPPYGNDWVKAPNLTDFANKAAVFNRHYTGSLPCMPARREIWTGTEEFWWRGWGPLEPWDRTISFHLHKANADAVTQLITDHYHFFEWGSHSYSYDFDGYNFIRGHEHDNYRTDPLREVPDWAQKMHQARNSEAEIYLRNVQDFSEEAHFFGPQVMQATADWLDRNHSHEQFYLHIDSFDVHEPFHIPEPYRSMYTEADYREHNPWPFYGPADHGPSVMNDAEIEWLRAQFAGKLTMVDTWLGRVFEQLDRHNLWDRTAVIITTDHGHFLGEHGWIGKPFAPLYDVLCHIPLMVWHPNGAHNGERVNALTQTIDLNATTLDLLGVELPQGDHIHSRSFAPVLRGEQDHHRDYAIYGYHNERIGITDGEWTLLREHDRNAAPEVRYTVQVDHLAARSIMMRYGWRRTNFEALEPGDFVPGAGMPVYRMPPETVIHHPDPPRDDYLFHSAVDPAQEDNRLQHDPDQHARLVDLLREHMLRLRAPEEQFARLNL